jgi:hypothetical protein
MGHEHQPTDRDKYVEFDCTKISGYLDALVAARKAIPHFMDYQLCTVPEYSFRFDFPGFVYVMSVGFGSPAKYLWMKADTEYDVDSIMSYSSFAHANAACAMGGHPEECPLRKLNVPGDRSKGVSYIEHAEKPSPGDVRWVRINYPYRGPHIDAVEGAGKHDGKKEALATGPAWDPYIERGKMTGEDPAFLRELDLRREKLVAEEKAARETVTALV